MRPCCPIIYGGLEVTTSNTDFPNFSEAVTISPSTISIFFSKRLYFTLLCAISTFSGCISSPVKCSPSVLAESRIGMMPFPVPRSIAFSPAFTFAKPDRSTASMPKQNLDGSCIIIRLFRLSSSRRSPSCSNSSLFSTLSSFITVMLSQCHLCFIISDFSAIL